MTVHVYRTATGRIPFADWFRSLKDVRARALIANRIDRLQLGHLGVRRFVGDGVWEFKLPFGPGYRISFGHEEGTIVILLGGVFRMTR